MSKKEQQGIDEIQCGRLDIYIPLIFETKLSFDGICHKINNGIDKDIKNHISAIQQDMCDIQADMEDKVLTEMNGKISLNQRVKKFMRDKRKNNHRMISRENMNHEIRIAMTENGIKIELPLEEVQTYDDMRKELFNRYNKYKEIYGYKFANTQDIYLLLPLHIKLNNGEYVWLNAMIFVFQNKMGILKLELPLKNVSSQPLMEYRYNEFIDGVENPWLVGMEVNEETIEGVGETYKENIINNYGIGVRQVGHSFCNILLSDFDGMPKQIGSITNKVMLDLYRIIAAPVTITDCFSYEKEAQEYIKEHQWTKHNSKFICSTTGRCLSMTDIAFRDYCLELYKQEYGVDKFEEQEKKKIYEKVVNNLCRNVEYAIIIMVLKYIAKEYLYELLLRKPEEMHTVKKEYNINIMYISELQENCFGTALEQIETFERVMPYYLKERITTDKLNAIDGIIADVEAERQVSIEKIIGLGGLVIAALFGLPAIHETVSIIRYTCTFIMVDIPIVTIKNFSVFVWIVVLCSLVFALSRWKGKKGRKFYSSK